MEEELKLKEGSPQQDEIEFSKRLHTIDELLQALKSVKHLTCDDELESYILKNREAKHLLPSLKSINGVSASVIEDQEREKEKQIKRVMTHMWKYAGTYRLVSENQMDEENIWYINDEVGSLIRHSDKPNMAVHPFIYAPNNALDAHTITYTICWPI